MKRLIIISALALLVATPALASHPGTFLGFKGCFARRIASAPQCNIYDLNNDGEVGTPDFILYFRRVLEHNNDNNRP